MCNYFLTIKWEKHALTEPMWRLILLIVYMYIFSNLKLVEEIHLRKPLKYFIVLALEGNGWNDFPHGILGNFQRIGPHESGNCGERNKSTKLQCFPFVVKTFCLVQIWNPTNPAVFFSASHDVFVSLLFFFPCNNFFSSNQQKTSLEFRIFRGVKVESCLYWKSWWAHHRHHPAIRDSIDEWNSHTDTGSENPSKLASFWGPKHPCYIISIAGSKDP